MTWKAVNGICNKQNDWKCLRPGCTARHLLQYRGRVGVDVYPEVKGVWKLGLKSNLLPMIHVHWSCEQAIEITKEVKAHHGFVQKPLHCNVNYNNLQMVSLPANTCSIYCLLIVTLTMEQKAGTRLLWETGTLLSRWPVWLQGGTCKYKIASAPEWTITRPRFVIFSFIKFQLFHACFIEQGKDIIFVCRLQWTSCINKLIERIQKTRELKQFLS